MTRFGIFFLCLSFNALLAQEREELRFDIQVIYQVSRLADSNDQETLRKRDMELLLNDEASLFQSVWRSQRDSTDLADGAVRFGTLLLAPVSKLNYQILKRQEQIKVYDSAFGINLQGVDEIYHYEESRDMLEWQLKADTLRIAGMLCQRADIRFGGRNWVAWFTPEIPIPDGPYKFCGLPGLIVSIADTKGHWQFEMTNIRNKEKVVTINFQSWFKFKAAPKEQLFRERKVFQDNLIATQVAAGMDLTHPTIKEYTHERAVKEIGSRLAKDNNWIELYP